MTEKAHVGDTDINQIMAKALKGEHSDYIKDHAGHYGDATSLDYFEAQTTIANANSLFEDLPSKIRNKFENNPAKFLDFVQDPKNLEEMVELKLANPPQDFQKTKVPEVVPPVAPPIEPTPAAPAATTQPAAPAAPTTP